MIVVFFKPRADDPDSGSIAYCTEASLDVVEAQDLPHIEAPELREDWDATHTVEGGVLTPIAPEILEARAVAAGWRKLRVARNSLLSEAVDPILMNPIRWGELTPGQQAALTAYRAALLAWPQTETDPLSPTPPTPPEFL